MVPGVVYTGVLASHGTRVVYTSGVLASHGTRVYIPQGVYMPPYCTPWWVSLPVCTTLYHPGYTTLRMSPVLIHLQGTQRGGDRALGSEEEKPLGRESLCVLTSHSCQGW